MVVTTDNSPLSYLVRIWRLGIIHWSQHIIIHNILAKGGLKLWCSSLKNKKTMSLWLFTTCTSHIIHLVCSPKFCITLCFSFLLGITAVPREIENNAYTKYWGDKQGAFWDMCKWQMSSDFFTTRFTTASLTSCGGSENKTNHMEERPWLYVPSRITLRCKIQEVFFDKVE